MRPSAAPSLLLAFQQSQLFMRPTRFSVFCNRTGTCKQPRSLLLLPWPPRPPAWITWQCRPRAADSMKAAMDTANAAPLSTMDMSHAIYLISQQALAGWDSHTAPAKYWMWKLQWWCTAIQPDHIRIPQSDYFCPQCERCTLWAIRFSWPYCWRVQGTDLQSNVHCPS